MKIRAVQIIIMSDSHLSPHAREAQINWDAVVHHVAAARPDLVLHLGDLSLDGANDPEDLRHARRELDRLAAPVHVIPGNHDIGDNPSPGMPASYLINDERRARWLDLVGPDHFCLRASGWTLLAVNAQLFGSGLAAEQAQWHWLERELADLAASGDRVALLSHKPLAAPDAELASAPAYRFVDPEARRRLRALSASRTFGLVASGHVHQHRRLELDGTCHLWAPTTWAVLPERAQRTLGAKRCGIVALELGAEAAVQAQPVEPAGLVQHTMFDDFPDPYAARHAAT
jgi:3',5'-cyclic AMP phosphodiesterase CpdA